MQHEQYAWRSSSTFTARWTAAVSLNGCRVGKRACAGRAEGTNTSPHGWRETFSTASYSLYVSESRPRTKHQDLSESVDVFFFWENKMTDSRPVWLPHGVNLDLKRLAEIWERTESALSSKQRFLEVEGCFYPCKPGLGNKTMIIIKIRDTKSFCHVLRLGSRLKPQLSLGS